MSYKKIGIANLMPGSEAWWLQQSAVNHPERSAAPTTVQAPDDVKRQQFADMRQPNLMMPTRTRGGGYRQPGMSEGELVDFKAQGNGDVVDLTGPNEMNKSQAQKISKQRAAGVLPEQNTKTVADRHQRTDVDETKANPENVEALQEELGLDGGNTVATRETAPGVGGYDDILALMKANALSEGDMARRQHSREIVTGLGDLVSSIANMWATTKGAPNAYDNAKGMATTSQSLYDRELARRKAQNENILNYYRVKKAAEDDAETREYRRQMADIRREESEERAAARKEANELKRDQLKLQREKEESAKKAREARIKYMDLLSDDKEIENAVYYGALAEAYDAGKDDEEAKSYARLKQRQYDDAQKAKSGKGKGKGGKSKGGNKSKKSTSTNTPPSRRSGNGDGNNVRPSQR